MLPANLADYSRHGIGMATAVERCSGMIDVHAFVRRGEPIRVAFAPSLAIGNDIEAGAFLVPDCQDRRVVLRLFQPFGSDTP